MTFSQFRRRHPAFIAAIAVILAGLLAIDGWVLYKGDYLPGQTPLELATAMTTAE